MKSILLTVFFYLITILTASSQEKTTPNSDQSSPNSIISKRQSDSIFFEENNAKKNSNEHFNGKIEITPNQSLSIITLKNVGSVKRVNVYNVLGMMLKSQKNYSDQMIIDVKDLKAGVYIIRTYKSDNSINQFRFVKD